MYICTCTRCVGVFYLLQKRRCEYVPQVHRVQAMYTGVHGLYTGVHRHLLTGCLPIVTINVTCASAEHFAIACKYFVWLHPTTVLRGKLTVCCHGVQVSCTPFRHGTWETDYIASVYFPCTMPKWGTTITCTYILYTHT